MDSTVAGASRIRLLSALPRPPRPGLEELLEEGPAALRQRVKGDLATAMISCLE